MADMIGERSILIQRSPQAVYDYVSDFPRHIEWNHSPVKMTQTTDGPMQVGTAYRTEEQVSSNMPEFMGKYIFPIMMKIMGVKGYTEAEITALEPTNRVAWKAGAPTGNGYAMTSTWELALESEGDGTKVTQRFHFTPHSGMAKMMANESQAQTIGEEVDNNLKTLKSILESQ